MAKSKTHELNGKTYTLHSTKASSTGLPIGLVPVLSTIDIDEYVVHYGAEQVIADARSGAAVRLQAAARRTAGSTKITQPEYDALYNELITKEVMQEAVDDVLEQKAYIDEYIQAVYDERKGNADSLYDADFIWTTLA